MSDDVKVALSEEFLARIAMTAQAGSSSDVEPINFDFDRNSPVTLDGQDTHPFLYARAESLTAR